MGLLIGDTCSGDFPLLSCRLCVCVCVEGPEEGIGGGGG